jgi:ADP-heptose:LPS heptosyltransferase
MSRLSGRIRTFARAIPQLVLKPLRRKPSSPARILIAHHLLLGDTLLLTPLLAKLRAQYPAAQIVLACPKPIVPLYSARPFGVSALPFDPRDLASVKAVLNSGPYELGIVVGDNRHSWLALGAGCRWIVAHAADVPAWKNWPVNEYVPYPSQPAAWADLATELIDGEPPRHYQTQDWPAPAAAGLPDDRLAERPYVVLHPGASTEVKQWPDQRWREVASFVARSGFTPVWSGGPGEVELIRRIGPESAHLNMAGRLGLADLWHLFSGARAVVCPDTGVAHLGRLTGVPTIALFGPGNASIHGAGQHWRDAPFVPVTITNMPCRDQPFIFRRKVPWARRCDRNVETCVDWRGDHAACMGRLTTESVCRELGNVLGVS